MSGSGKTRKLTALPQAAANTSYKPWTYTSL